MLAGGARMVFEDVLKIVGAVVAIATSMYTLWQLTKSDKQGKWGRMRDEYKFAKEFLVELRTTPGMSDFEKAKGYQAIAGFQAIEGDYLMSLEEPAKQWIVMCLGVTMWNMTLSVKLSRISVGQYSLNPSDK